MDDKKVTNRASKRRGVEHNLNSNVKVVTKRIDELKVLEKEIADAAKDTDEITQVFIEATELEVNIYLIMYLIYIKYLSNAGKFLS